MENQNLVPEKKTSGLAIASFVCALVAIFLGCTNLGYLLSAVAIVLGIVALACKKKPVWMSVTGICVAGGAIILTIVLDVVLGIMTAGLTLFI